MRKFKKTILNFILTIGLATVLVASGISQSLTAEATSAGEVQGQIDQHTNELNNANQRVVALETEQEILQEQIDDFNAELANTMASIGAMEDELAAKEQELAQKLAYDPDLAKSILAEAGWTDSNGDGILDKNGENLSFELLIPSDRAAMKAAGPVIQNQFAAIGVDAQIREYEGSYIKQLMKEDDYVMGGRNYVWNDADILYYVFTAASGYPWDDPAVTAAFEAARVENDVTARVAAYEKAQDLLVDQYKAISVFADNYCVASKNSIKGLVVTNDGRSWFNDVTAE